MIILKSGAMKREKFKMTTRWGRRHGWELQLLKWGKGDQMWRVTGKNWCHPATSTEETMWKALMRDRGEKL